MQLWDTVYQILFSLLIILFFLLLGSSSARRAATPAKLLQCDRGRKLSNSAPRRLFINTFAETYFAKGSYSYTGRCHDTFVQILSCGIPLSTYSTCIKFSGRQPCWLQQVVSAWICAFWPLEVVRERGKKILFSTRQSAAASHSRIFSGTLWFCPPELPQNCCTFLACM